MNSKNKGIMLRHGDTEPEHGRDDISVKNILSPEIVERTINLLYTAKVLVDGTLSGMHRSYHTGQSVEFRQHKEYSQGDDLRSLDWKAFGKSDRYFIKQYETETNAKVIIILDASASMNYGSSGRTKIEYARILSASLALLFLNQFDEVGLLILSGRGNRYHPPHRGRPFINEIAKALVLAEAEGTVDIARAFRFVAEKLWRGIVILISDLLADEEDLVRNARYLQANRNDVVILQVLDEDELTFGFKEPARFIGLEDEGGIQADPEGIKELYLKELNNSINLYKKEFRMSGIDYLLINTAIPVEKALSDLLLIRN